MILPNHSAYRRGRLEIVNQNYAAFLARGFPTATFDGEPEPETLQCRNELDRTNWLGLLAKCNEIQRVSVETEQPELMDLPGARLRCSSNRMYDVSFASAKDRMLVLLSQAEAAQVNWWALKDSVRAAETRQDLFALDLNAGWP